MTKMIMFLSILGMLVLPAMAFADASVVQLWCEEVNPGDEFIRVHFSVVNFSLPEPVYGLSLMSEPFPPFPECEPVDCDVPEGWVCLLNGFGGVDFITPDPSYSIGQQDSYGEFIIDLPSPDASFCCYEVLFIGPDGGVLLAQEECFSCAVVPEEETSWGFIKLMYR